MLTRLLVLLLVCGQAAPEWKQFTMEEFKWARMMVASRNFGVNVRGHVSVAVARNCVRETRDSSLTPRTAD